LKIEELVNHEMGQNLNFAEERVKNAILFVSVGKKRGNYVEIPSCPCNYVSYSYQELLHKETVRFS